MKSDVPSPLALEGTLVLPGRDLLVLLVQATGDQAEFAFGSLEGPVDVDEREGRDGRDGGDERCDLDRCKLLQPFLYTQRPLVSGWSMRGARGETRTLSV